MPRSDTETIYMKAKEYKVTPAAVLCTVYMKVLAEYAESPEFSINLTVFNRLSANREVQEVLGDFTNISIAVYEAKKGRSFKEEVLETQKEFWNLVKYRGYEGVKIIRKMPKNNPVQASLPVVFTGILQGLKQSDYYLPIGQEKFMPTARHLKFLWIIRQRILKVICLLIGITWYRHLRIL